MRRSSVVLGRNTPANSKMKMMLLMVSAFASSKETMPESADLLFSKE
jgi:hypothetical protein